MPRYPIPQPVLDGLAEINDKILPPTNILNADDWNCTIEFLQQYNGNTATFNAYRREVERLLQWSWLIKQASILILKRQDIEEYIAFCLKPPRSWIATHKSSRFKIEEGIKVPNTRWRPFVVTVSKSEHKQGIKPSKENYQLSQKAIREIFTVLGSFYNYLQLEEKVLANPIALIRQKSKFLQKRQTQAPVRRLTDEQWTACLKTAQTMADTDSKYERALFVLNALYLLYLRISELAASERWMPLMNHFYQDSQERWWFKTVGKGNKLREIAVSDEMLEALQRYRKSQQLSSLPSPHEQTPLISKQLGQGAISSTKLIYDLVQHCFDKTVGNLRAKGRIEAAANLEVATAHWLRHTGISDDINKRGRPLAHVRDDAGHSSMAVTDRYNDIELIERHKSAKNKKAIIQPEKPFRKHSSGN
ncbi:MAG: Phage integrase family protein [Gammaproteobacteria bacterium]|jgi:site-specific recombinase XerD|nr:Phage integrase family protein [Gammaproteobacteria bacterium]